MKIEHIAMYVNDLVGARDFFLILHLALEAKNVSMN